MFDYYPHGYRDDEEIYVDDQCCGNCANINCPMYAPDDAPEKVKRSVKKRRKEDAIERDGELDWCIYWKQRHGDSRGSRGCRGGYR